MWKISVPLINPMENGAVGRWALRTHRTMMLVAVGICIIDCVIIIIIVCDGRSLDNRGDWIEMNNTRANSSSTQRQRLNVIFLIVLSIGRVCRSVGMSLYIILHHTPFQFLCTYVVLHATGECIQRNTDVLQFNSPQHFSFVFCESTHSQTQKPNEYGMRME